MALPLSVPAPGAAARTQVLRSEPGEVPWELWRRDPPPALAGRVLGLWAGVSPEASARHRTLPNGELMLMLHLGSTQRLVERDGAPCDERLGTGFLAGLQERPATFACVAPRTRVAAVRLAPHGACALLGGLPQAELAGGVLDVEALFGARAGVAELTERMTEAGDFGAALDLLEAWLLARLDAASPHPATSASWMRLRASGGNVRVAQLSRDAGVSRRRLHELFLREVGLPPKRLARILRFRRALEALSRAPEADLARLAQECGYYDQSHLYRDFRALAAMTPLDYLAAHGDGLDGPDVVAG